MASVKVTLVHYKLKNKKKYQKGIQILNRNSNTFTTIDCKTLQKVIGEYEWYESLEQSAGNIFFNFKY